MTSVAEIRVEALSRARGGQSTANYSTIFAGFGAMGIAESEIDPRENVLTYRAWQALDRQVRKGEHGVKVTTRRSIPAKKDPETGEVVKTGGSMPWTATVFHVSQTDPIGGGS